MGTEGVRWGLTLALVLSACLSDPALVLPEVDEITVGDTELRVWVADEATERRQGLMGVGQLPEGIDGMLFSWPTPVSASFTMEDTEIALDIWWIDADRTVIGSAAMEPCPSGDCVSYRSPGPVKWALETPVGEVEIEPGDRLSTTGSS